MALQSDCRNQKQLRRPSRWTTKRNFDKSRHIKPHLKAPLWWQLEQKRNKIPKEKLRSENDSD